LRRQRGGSGTKNQETEATMSVETVQETLQQAAAASSSTTLLGFSPMLTTLVGTLVAMALYEYWRRNSREYRMVANIPSAYMHGINKI